MADITDLLTKQAQITLFQSLLADLTDLHNMFSTMLTGSATYDPASLADGAGATTTVTVTGAALGDLVLPSFSVDLAGVSVTAYVSAANTVSVRFQNESGGTVDLASGTIVARVFKNADLVAPAALTTTS